MQEVFEKIIEKLEALENVFIKGNSHNVAAGISRAIEIVKQEYEEFNSNQINQLAMMYAKNLVKYGVDVTKIWNTAIQQTYSLNESYMRGVQDERDRFNKYNNGWIPCSERLPNQDGEFTDVIITCESIADGVFVQSAEFYIATDGSPVFDALYHYERVLAWQPLLQPYQPKGEDE